MIINCITLNVTRLAPLFKTSDIFLALSMRSDISNVLIPWVYDENRRSKSDFPPKWASGIHSITFQYGNISANSCAVVHKFLRVVCTWKHYHGKSQSSFSTCHLKSLWSRECNRCSSLGYELLSVFCERFDINVFSLNHRACTGGDAKSTLQSCRNTVNLRPSKSNDQGVFGIVGNP